MDDACDSNYNDNSHTICQKVYCSKSVDSNFDQYKPCARDRAITNLYAKNYKINEKKKKLIDL